MNLDFSRRGDLSLQLTAPSGTTSPMTRKRNFDNLLRIKNLTDWVMTTLFHWGESPIGQWELSIADLDTRYPSTGKGRRIIITIVFLLVLFGEAKDIPLNCIPLVPNCRGTVTVL